MRRFLPVLALAIGGGMLTPRAAEAWGREEHRIVAAIAESRLTPAALEKVQGVLGEGVSLPSVAVWADQVRPARGETAPWHYVNITLVEGAFSHENCPGGDCVTLIINRLEQQLAGYESMEGVEAEEALKFLVHFLGDQSQPMHNANDSGDRGGNDRKVNYYGRDTNLHAIWDYMIMAQEMKERELDPEALAKELNAEVRAESLTHWTSGTTIDWTNQAHAVARDFAYPTWKPVMGEEYQRLVLGAARVQMQRGGVRTAHVLNRIFDPAYDGVPVVQRDLALPFSATDGVKPDLPALYPEKAAE